VGLNHKVELKAKADEAGKRGEAKPMTGAQAAHLKLLADEVSEPTAFAGHLSRHEASRRIEVLTERLRLGALPPHTD